MFRQITANMKETKYSIRRSSDDCFFVRSSLGHHFSKTLSFSSVMEKEKASNVMTNLAKTNPHETFRIVPVQISYEILEPDL